MSKRQHIDPLRILVSLIAALPFPLVTVVLRAGYSPMDRLDSPLLLSFWMVIAAASFLIVAGACWLTLGATTSRAFTGMGAILAIAVTATTVWFGVNHHRDYFSALFIDPVVFYCIILFWFQARPMPTSRPLLKALGVAGLVVYVLFVVWILMMGYAISTRAEPRPIESLMYNAYNVFLAFTLLVLSRTVYLRSWRTVELRGEGILLDGKPVDAILGSQEIAILKAFLADRQGRMACSALQSAIDRASPGRRVPEGCASCDPKDAKATRCTGYRGLYNRVLAIKRLLEFLEVGTILAPENKFQILTEGWKLALFEGVRVRGIK